ncbi:MAG: nitrilase-related carbon-nitrogen hydrolase [Chloroflexota bacterium]
MSATTNIKVGLAQMQPKIGDVKANLDTHLEYIVAAKNEGVDLLLFPELSLTGYNVQDLVYEIAMQPTEDNPIFQPLLQASADYNMDIMVGFVDTDNRARYFIGAAYLSGGKVLHVHHKVYLCTYTMFDEGRYFALGDSVRAFDTRFGRLGMLICEDFWHASPPYLLWLDRADLLLFHSASPGRGIDASDRLSSAHWVQLVNQAYGSMFTNYVIHCNRVGFEDGLNFWGGSTIIDPDGDIIAEGPMHEEALIIQNIDLNQLRRTRTRLPLLRDERPSLIAGELARIMQATPVQTETQAQQVKETV